jgi:long-chain acyl-CoA synthetase
MPFDNIIKSSTSLDQSPLSMLYHWESTRGDETFLNQPVNGVVEQYSWKEVANLARRVASQLAKMSFPKGSRIGIFSKNCAEWFIADLGIMMAGHVSVPISISAGFDTIQYILRHADVKLMFIGKIDNPQSQLAAVPINCQIVNLPHSVANCSMNWIDFINCIPVNISPLRELDEVLTITYTSSSTGQPKGVVHTFRSLSWTGQATSSTFNLKSEDRLLSYLPLAHTVERVFVEYASIYSGCSVYFVESQSTFQRDIKNCRPSIFVSTPRLWSKFQLSVLAKTSQSKLDFLLALPWLKNIIAKQIRNQLGFDNVRIWVSGSAPLAPAIIHWFHRLEINISEGWGMSENCGYSTANLPFRADKIGCIGKPYNGVKIRLSEQGEIQVKAPNTMLEYYLQPQQTVDVFTEDGYLKTGDEGEIDNEGFVRINGRLKDFFKTSKNKYVAPAPIEAQLMQHTIIGQVCVVGNNLIQPICLVILSDAAQTVALTAYRYSIIDRLNTILTNINSRLESHQQLARMLIMPSPWIVENGLLTPTLKVKRQILEQRFDQLVHAEYAEKVVFVDCSLQSTN